MSASVSPELLVRRALVTCCRPAGRVSVGQLSCSLWTESDLTVIIRRGRRVWGNLDSSIFEVILGSVCFFKDLVTCTFDHMCNIDCWAWNDPPHVLFSSCVPMVKRFSGLCVVCRFLLLRSAVSLTTRSLCTGGGLRGAERRTCRG